MKHMRKYHFLDLVLSYRFMHCMGAGHSSRKWKKKILFLNLFKDFVLLRQARHK